MVPTYAMTTPRLRLYAPSRMEVDAMQRGNRNDLAMRLGVSVSEQWWSGPSMLRLIPHLSAKMANEPGDARWIWMVIEPITANVIGDIGFHDPPHAAATAEIGYSVIPQARGNGYTTEAAAAIMRWTFAHIQVAQIIAQIAPANTASLRVASKLGMQELAPLSTEYRCFGITNMSKPIRYEAVAKN